MVKLMEWSIWALLLPCWRIGTHGPGRGGMDMEMDADVLADSGV